MPTSHPHAPRFAIGSERNFNSLLGKPDLDYITYGDYSKKDNAVVVQIPMPEKVAKGAADQVTFIIDSLRGANAMAFEFFRQRGGTEYPLRNAEALVSKVAERIASA